MKAPTSKRPCILISAYDKQILWQTFSYPDGREEQFLLFGSKKEASIVFPLSTKGEVIAVNHFREGANAHILELPGGCFDSKDRTRKKTAERELREETGYECDKILALRPRSLWFDPASVRVRFFPFLALGCRNTGRASDEAENITIKKIPLEKWFTMILDGKVADSKSVATSMIALPYLRKYLKERSWSVIGSILDR